MNEVLLINPGLNKRRPRKGPKKGATKMARKRGARRRRSNPDNPRRKSVKKYYVYARPRRRKNPENPVNPRRRRRRANPSNPSRFGRGILGLDFFGIGRDVIPMSIGAIAGQIASKKLDADETTGGATQPWTWKNYLLCVLGSYLAGIIMSMVRPGSGSQIRRQAVNGGLLLVIYNLVTKELTAKNETVMGLLGESSAGGDAWRYMKPGDVWQGRDGKQYLLASDMSWRPMSLGAASMADVVDAERYGDIVEAERYGQAESMPPTGPGLPTFNDPYFRQYMPF